MLTLEMLFFNDLHMKTINGSFEYPALMDLKMWILDQD